MKAILPVTALMLLTAGSPCFAQQASSDQKAQRTESKTSPSQGHGAKTSGRIPVQPADSIIGRMVRDSSGNAAGEVKYILISAATGRVEDVLVGPGGILNFTDREVTAVPWEQVAEIPDQGDIRLKVSKDKLNQAPRLSADAISDLTKPAVITSIIDYYAKPDQQGGQSQAQAPQSQAQQGQAGKPQSGQQASSKNDARMLVGETIVTTLSPPLLARPQRMEGAEVVAQDGKEIGDIDHVMIDTSHGQVAYVLLARGGFLGVGEEWVPVPMAALQWSGDNYRLAGVSPDKLQPLKRDQLPHKVSVAQLDQLNQRFGITAYTQQVAEMREGEGNAGQSPQ